MELSSLCDDEWKQHGTVIELQCKPDYPVLEENGAIKCDHEEWKLSSRNAGCRQRVCQCSKLLEVMGEVYWTDHCSEYKDSGESVQLYCSSGYSITDKFPSTQCKNGTWTVINPSCKKDCTTDELLNSTIYSQSTGYSISTVVRGLVRDSMIVVMVCEKGYQLLMNQNLFSTQLELTCRDGKWLPPNRCQIKSNNETNYGTNNEPSRILNGKPIPNTNGHFSGNQPPTFNNHNGSSLHISAPISHFSNGTSDKPTTPRGQTTTHRTEEKTTLMPTAAEYHSCACGQLAKILIVKHAIPICDRDFYLPSYNVYLQCMEGYNQTGGLSTAHCSETAWATTDIICEEINTEQKLQPEKIKVKPTSGASLATISTFDYQVDVRTVETLNIEDINVSTIIASEDDAEDQEKDYDEIQDLATQATTHQLCEEKQCRFRPKLFEGMVVYINGIHQKNTSCYPEGTEKRIYCQLPGRQYLDGYSTQLCNNGNWTRKIPKCFSFIERDPEKPPVIKYEVDNGNILSEVGTLSVEEGASVTLTCLWFPSKGTPNWYFESQVEPLKNTGWNDPNSGSGYNLYLDRVKPKNSGTYKCFTPYDMNSIVLHVDGSPTPTITMTPTSTTLPLSSSVHVNQEYNSSAGSVYGNQDDVVPHVDAVSQPCTFQATISLIAYISGKLVDNRSSIPQGQRIKLSCNNYVMYQLIGPLTSVCVNGRWIPPLPICEELSVGEAHTPPRMELLLEPNGKFQGWYTEDGVMLFPRSWYTYVNCWSMFEPEIRVFRTEINDEKDVWDIGGAPYREEGRVEYFHGIVEHRFLYTGQVYTAVCTTDFAERSVSFKIVKICHLNEQFLNDWGVEIATTSRKPFYTEGDEIHLTCLDSSGIPVRRQSPQIIITCTASRGSKMTWILTKHETCP